MNVADVMTHRPLTIDLRATPELAWQEMDAHRVRHLPVVADGAVVGVVSNRDLIAIVARQPASISPAGRAEAAWGPKTVRDLMHAPPTTVGPGASLMTAASEMDLHRVGCLPVVDGDTLVGILTDMDLLAAFERARRDGAIDERHDPRVSALMSRDVAALTPKSTFGEAARLCRERWLRHLPVLRHGELVGIVSDRDLRLAASRHEPPDLPVESLMTEDVATVRTKTAASEAARTMVTRRVGALPVVADGAVVGMLTSTDLIEHCVHALGALESPARA